MILGLGIKISFLALNTRFGIKKHKFLGTLLNIIFYLSFFELHVVGKVLSTGLVQSGKVREDMHFSANVRDCQQLLGNVREFGLNVREFCCFVREWIFYFGFFQYAYFFLNGIHFQHYGIKKA